MPDSTAPLHPERERIPVARCTVARLMGTLGLRGVVRGRRVRTTIRSALAERPRDLVEPVPCGPSERNPEREVSR